MMKTYRDNITRSANLLPFNQLQHHYGTFVMYRDFVMWAGEAGSREIPIYFEDTTVPDHYRSVQLQLHVSAIMDCTTVILGPIC